jgi:hypothetical protein
MSSPRFDVGAVLQQRKHPKQENQGRPGVVRTWFPRRCFWAILMLAGLGVETGLYAQNPVAPSAFSNSTNSDALTN